MSGSDGIKIAQTLRDAILRIELRPGVILDEAELAARLKVSRTPVREAIIQLVADGLVVRQGRKAKVAPLDFDDVPKLYDALLISSRLVNRLAAENRSEADLKEMTKHMEAFETAMDVGNGLIRSEANFAFHKAISAAADNKYVSAFYEQALVGTLRLARVCFSDTENVNGAEVDKTLKPHLLTTIEQHRKIRDVIKARDIEAADALAVEHYQLTKRRIMKVLFDQSSALMDVPNLSLDTWVETEWPAEAP